MELTPLDQFFERLAGDQRMIALVLHELILSIDDSLSSRLRYNIPFYDSSTWICYINPRKENSVELCFLQGVSLVDESGLLQSRGRKQVAGVLCNSLDNIPADIIIDLVQQALRVIPKK